MDLIVTAKVDEKFEMLEWQLDSDHATDNFRGIQFMPPVSEFSVIFGKNINAAVIVY